MSEIFPLLVKLLGSKVDDGADTLSVLLRDNRGGDGVLHFTPDAAKALAFELLAVVGKIEHIQEQGLDHAGAVGEMIRTTAIPIRAFRIDWTDMSHDAEKAHLHFWAKSMAHFPLALEKELIDQLRLRLSRSHA